MHCANLEQLSLKIDKAKLKLSTLCISAFGISIFARLDFQIQESHSCLAGAIFMLFRLRRVVKQFTLLVAASYRVV